MADNGWSIDPTPQIGGWRIDPTPEEQAARDQWTVDPLHAPKKPTPLLDAVSGGEHEPAPQTAHTADDLGASAPTVHPSAHDAEHIPASPESLGEYAGDLGKSFGAGVVSAVGMGVRGLGRESQRIHAVLGKALGGDDKADAFINDWLGPTLPFPLSAVGTALNPDTAQAATTIGQGIQNFSDKINVAPERQQQVGNIIANATGQVAGMIGISMVGGEAAVGSDILGQSFDQMDQALKEKGVKDDSVAGLTAQTAGGAVQAALERTGLEVILEGVPTAIKSRVLRGLADVAITGGFEGLEEVSQQIVQNFATKLGVDPNTPVRDWGKGLEEGVLPNFEGGAGAGAIVRAVLGKWGAHPAPHQEQQQTYAPPGIRESAVANAAQPTPEDEASPLPTALITQGKATIAAAGATGDANQVLQGAGMPTVGTRVDVTHNGRTRTGAVADAWTIDVGGQTSTGIKIKLDDGTMIEEPVESLRGMGVTVKPVELPSGLPEADTNDPIVQELASQGMANVRAAQEGAESASEGGWSIDTPTPEGQNRAPATPSAAGKANIPQDVVQGLMAEGIPEHVARAAAAGTVAEAGGRETATNSASGAFGLGQWLGSRKQALIDRYGPNPTRAQQIQFLAYELKGGDPGGAAVLAAKDEQSALQAYITKFMRPAAGKETTSDIQRGMAALGRPGAQTDMFGGPERTGTEMDATRAVDRAAEDEDTDKVDLLDRAHEVLTADANDDSEHVADSGSRLGDLLGTTVTPEEAPDYARAVLQRFGQDQHGYALEGPTTRDLGEGFKAFGSHTGTLDIPREQMPQIKAEHRGAMVNFLNARGIEHEEVNLPAHAIKPSQVEFSPEKVAKAKAFTGGNRAILIDENNRVVDGHHQFVAAHDLGDEVRAIRLKAPVQKIADELKDMPSVESGEGGVDSHAGAAQNQDISLEAAATESQPLVVKEGFKTPQLAGMWIKSNKLATPRYQVEDDQHGAYRVIDTAPTARTESRIASAPTTSDNEIAATPAKADEGAPVVDVAPSSKPLPRSTTRKGKPVNVISFIRQMGGIKDSENHDLSRGRGLRRHPGLINNKSGHSIDEVGEALHEAGYIGTPDHRPTEAEVLDLIDRANNRPIYTLHEQEEADHASREEVARGREEEAEFDVRETAKEAGLNLNDDEIGSALHYHLAEGMTVPAAIDRAIRQSAALDLLDIAANTRSEYDYADVANEIFTGPHAEARGGAEEGSRRSVDLAGTAAEGQAPAREPATPAPAEEARPAEGRSSASPADTGQLDAFGERAGYRRRALERQGEGRLRSDKPQKPPGSDGGLFDSRDTTGDLLDQRTASATATEGTAAGEQGTAAETTAAPPRAGMVPLFDDEDTSKQVGWIDPASGSIAPFTNRPDADSSQIRAQSDRPAAQAARSSVEISPSDVDRIRERLLQRMEQLGLKDRYALEVANGLKLARNGTLGQIDLYNRIISIALDRSRTPEHSLNHEAIHALGPNGLRLITPAEWDVLVEAAWADDRLREWAQTSRAYQHLNLDDQKEEAAAEYVADAVDAMRGRAVEGAPLGRVNGIIFRTIHRVARFWNALRHAVSYLRTGAPAEDRPIDVVLRIDRGNVGARKGRLEGRAASVTFGKKVLSEAPTPVAPVREARTLAEAKQAARAFVGKRLSNPTIGVDAVVSGNTLGKMTSASAVGKSSSGADHSLAVANLDKLYPAAVEVDRNPDKRGQPTVRSIIRAVAQMRTADSRLVNVHMLVKETTHEDSPNPLYTVSVEEVRPASVPDETARASGQNLNAPPADLGADISAPHGTDNDIRAQAAAPPAAGPMARNVSDDEAAPPRLLAPVRAILDNLGPKGTSQRLGDAIDNVRYILQDRMLPVLRVQTKVERILGRPIADEENPYLAEELFHGRTGARLDDLMSNHVEPLFNAMKTAGVTSDELETYAYARHAPERNARIAKINPEFGSDLLGEKGAGSGMTDAEAAQIIDAAHATGKGDVLEALADRLEAINDFALQTRVDAGLLSPDEAAMWRNAYEHYVPLRGRPGEGEEALGHMNRSSGYSVRGAESRRAFGRKSRAQDIIPYSIMQAEEAIVRAEQNEVAEALHRLVEAAPDRSFWQINKVNRVPVFNKSTGLVSYRNESRIAAEDAPYTVVAKRGGTEYRITFNRNNPAAVRVASAIRNLDVQQFKFVVATFGALNRLQSAMITRFAPNFIVTNAFRDIQTAVVNLAGVDLKGLEHRVLKDYPAALVAATKGEFGKGKGDWAKWYSAFKGQGGHVAFNDLSDISTLRKKVARAVDAGQKSRLGVRKMLSSMLEVVDHMNGGVENALRLATYKNAVELGATPKQAASLAKNVTVNFNRKGTAGPLINSLYLFFNASVQGNVRIMQAMKSKKVRRILMASVLLGLLMHLLNRKLSDRDDDGELFYDKIPEYDKEHNFIFMYPGAKDRPIKIPMPWGYNSFPNMGRMFGRLIEGEKPTTAISDWLWSVVDSFNPLGGAENIVRTLSPSAFDPVVDLYTNRDYAGRPIMPDPKDPGQQVPNSQRYWKSVAPYDKWITDKLNELTGGDTVRPGVIDISPEVLNYLQSTILGGVGTFAKQLMAMGSKAVANDPNDRIEMSDIPFASRLIANKPAWYDKSAFYERLAQVEQDVTYGRKYIKSGDGAGLMKLGREEGDVLAMENTAKAARKVMRRIAKDRGIVDNDLARGVISQSDADRANRVLEAQEENVINNFNARYLATVKQPLRP